MIGQDVVTVSEDAFIRAGSFSDDNFDTKGLVVKESPTNQSFTRRTFLKFNVNEYSTINSATLNLTVNQSNGSSVPVVISGSDDNWSEQTITWNTAPQIANAIGSFDTGGSTNGDKNFSIDISAYVQSQLNSGDGLISIQLADPAQFNENTNIIDKEADFNKAAYLNIDGVKEDISGFYIDAVDGNDNNNGTTPETAWQSLDNINSTTFQPGDFILFRAGQSWTGTIKPRGSGVNGSPITIGRYGNGDRPILNGDGTINCTTDSGRTKYCTIYLHNQEYWEIKDLEITNYDPSEEGGLSLEGWEQRNRTDYIDVFHPPKYLGTNSKKCGILYEANDMGAINHLHFINLKIHGVNGDISDKDNGGIYLQIFNNSSSDLPTYFDDLLFENCHIHDVDRTAISNSSDYDTRTLTSNTNWTPSLNYIIRNCIFERSGANAVIQRVAERPIFEHNLLHECSIKGSGNAYFCFNTDNALIRFNEGRHTKYNVGDNDAGALDSDFRTKNTIIEYNYVHDNDFGTLITGGKGTGTGFNDNTNFRYNILENDGILEEPNYGAWAFKISGNATNTHVYNNVIYTGPSKSYTEIVFHKRLGGGEPDRSTYTNNIFFNDGSETVFNIDRSTNNSFSNNIFYGNPISDTPSDPDAITVDPQLSNPGGGLNGYHLSASSPAISSGDRVTGTPNRDFYNNPIFNNVAIDRGVEQVSINSGQCPNFLTVNGLYGINDVLHFSANQSINIDATIQTDAYILTTAGDEIEMNIGFNVETGATFLANTSECQ